MCYVVLEAVEPALVLKQDFCQHVIWNRNDRAPLVGVRNSCCYLMLALHVHKQACHANNNSVGMEASFHV